MLDKIKGFNLLNLFLLQIKQEPLQDIHNMLMIYQELLKIK
jgi:hypothetical protein